MLGDKLRFRFSKTGTLRLLSHHDLMRCLERMLRRGGLPFKSTAGFHPGPRVVFAQSLPLGVAGLDEVVEIEFTHALEDAETLAALGAQSPAGLAFTRVAVVPMKATAIPRRIVYRLELPPERVHVTEERCAELMGQEKVWVERVKPSPKRLNIRPYLRGVSVASGAREVAGVKRSTGDLTVAARLVLDLWVTQTGTARADELLKLLDVADLVEAGAVVERTTVELRDEVSSLDPADSPPDGPAETRPLDPAAVAVLVQKAEEPYAMAGWGALPAGPVVE